MYHNTARLYISPQPPWQRVLPANTAITPATFDFRKDPAGSQLDVLAYAGANEVALGYGIIDGAALKQQPFVGCDTISACKQRSGHQLARVPLDCRPLARWSPL